MVIICKDRLLASRRRLLCDQQGEAEPRECVEAPEVTMGRMQAQLLQARMARHIIPGA
jgi:hypothetical protein